MFELAALASKNRGCVGLRPIAVLRLLLALQWQGWSSCVMQQPDLFTSAIGLLLLFLAASFSAFRSSESAAKKSED